MPETVKEFENTGVLVRKLMGKDIQCRNSDKWLCYSVYQEIAKANGKQIFIPFELFQVFPSFETITRMRRFVQHNERMLLPTDPSVVERRMAREKKIKELMK